MPAMDLEGIVQNTDAFLSTGKASCADQLKNNLKTKYDKFISDNKLVKNSLPQLVIDGFDLEQIWQQLELNYEKYLTSSLIQASDLCRKTTQLLFPILKDLQEDSESEESAEDDELADKENEIKVKIGLQDENENSDNISDKADDMEMDETSPQNASVEDDEGSEFDDESEGHSEDDRKKSDTRNKFNKKSVVDDEFFSLNQMENFLNKVENEEPKKKKKGSDEESDSDEESIDYFKDSDEEDDEGIEDDADDEDNENDKNPMYADFFEEQEQEAPRKKRKKFELDSDVSDLEQDELDSNLKSTLEMREERIKKKIKHLEEEALAEKPWQFKGEVTSESRPENSLLEKVLEFDLTSRPAPVITEESNLQLEDIIRKRIKDKVFDSVERKEKPVDTPLEYKKKLVLDSEKSKQSLAQIYENEYLQQKEAMDPSVVDKPEEEPENHKEIRVMLTSLFQQLDALSNFHYTPRNAAPELKIISNLPAITLEEVAPVTSTDASALAPEEIRPKKIKGDEIGESERSKTDKKRDRRKKKIKQKQHANMKKKKDEKLKEKGILLRGATKKVKLHKKVYKK